MSIDIIIPCAGLATRMRGNTAKSLVQINGESLINRQIRVLRTTFDKPRIIVVLGYQADDVEAQLPDDVEVAHNYAFDKNGVACSIGIGLRRSKKKCLIVYGDLVFDTKLFDFPMTVSCLLSHKSEKRDGEVGLTKDEDGLRQLSYSAEDKWCHVAFLDKQGKQRLLEVLRSPYTRNWFGYELFNQAVADGAKFKVIETQAKLAEVDSQKDLIAAVDIFKNHETIKI